MLLDIGERAAILALSTQTQAPTMPRFFFFVRLTFAWLFLLVFTFMIWSTFTRRGMGGIFLAWLVVMCFVYASAATHIRRVRLVNGTVTASALANRQRRQIEVPMEAAQAFDILDATIRELPNVDHVVSVRESLQIHAKVRRVYPLGATVPLLQRMLGWFGTEHNQVYAIITPHPETGTVNLSCEPESGTWRDWFTVDSGTNLENAETISRAISRRTTEVRRGEQAVTKETEIEKELAVAKLRLLHAQVEPHFLYNTLGSAKYLIRSDPAGAERIIDNLILYLRHSLPRLDNSLTTLGEEMERVRAYLEIMQIRMGTRLRTELSVPDALKSVPFPTMMLQTLVENAIKHGLEPKSGGGTIWVLAVDKAGQVSITVADDGNGFGTETTGSGIGLQNVRERLHLAYGADATFDIAANFPTGVAATISVPMTGPKEVRHD
jgi:signal transduction histidine kinase